MNSGGNSPPPPKKKKKKRKEEEKRRRNLILTHTDVCLTDLQVFTILTTNVVECDTGKYEDNML